MREEKMNTFNKTEEMQSMLHKYNRIKLKNTFNLDNQF